MVLVAFALRLKTTVCMWNEGCDSRSDASLRVAPVLPLVQPTALKLEVESFSSLSHLATSFLIYSIKTIKHNYFHPFILAGPFKGHWKIRKKAITHSCVEYSVGFFHIVGVYSFTPHNSMHFSMH